MLVLLRGVYVVNDSGGGDAVVVDIVSVAVFLLFLMLLFVLFFDLLIVI